MFESKKKTQILIEFLDWTQKSPASRQKKFPSRQKSSPYVMFESKKPQILIEFLDGTKKVQLTGKKVSWLPKKVS